MKDRIFQLMKSTGKTQKDFAEELCIAQATLSGIFKGTTKPSMNIVTSIHECFPQINIQWLLFGNEPMYVDEICTESPLPNPAPTVSSQDSQPNSSYEAAIHDSIPIPVVRETVKYIDKPARKITEIRVFYDDGTYETFQPSVG